VRYGAVTARKSVVALERASVPLKIEILSRDRGAKATRSRVPPYTG
jgi:hypothetical protein